MTEKSFKTKRKKKKKLPRNVRKIVDLGTRRSPGSISVVGSSRGQHLVIYRNSFCVKGSSPPNYHLNFSDNQRLLNERDPARLHVQVRLQDVEDEKKAQLKMWRGSIKSDKEALDSQSLLQDLSGRNRNSADFYNLEVTRPFLYRWNIFQVTRFTAGAKRGNPLARRPVREGLLDSANTLWTQLSDIRSVENQPQKETCGLRI